MAFSLLILGLVIFLGTHAFTTARATRSALISQLGIRLYKRLYSISAAIGLGLVIWGFGHYRDGDYVQVWFPPAWAHLVTLILLWFAVVLVVSAYAPPGEIKRRLRHPMILGIAVWAAGHLIANGDLAGITVFGAFLVWAVFDRIAVARRETVEGGPAIASGGLRNDLLAIALATVVYLLIVLWLHRVVIGISVLPIS